MTACSLSVPASLSALLVLTGKVLSKSPELNTICYGQSTYHVASKSAVVYDGELNTTLTGASCYHWKVDPFTSNAPDHSHVLDETHNFCRGVDTRYGRPWCYIDLESSDFSVRNPALRRGWDWCGVAQCRYYRTECQKLRDRFDNAELEYTRSLHSEAKDTEPVPHDECRPECDDNGDFELVQHCNRQFKKTEESTGACVTWDNNGEHQDFVYNRMEKICEKYTSCRHARYTGKGVKCDADGLEIKVVIAVESATSYSGFDSDSTETATPAEVSMTTATEAQPYGMNTAFGAGDGTTIVIDESVINESEFEVVSESMNLFTEMAVKPLVELLSEEDKNEIENDDGVIVLDSAVVITPVHSNPRIQSSPVFNQNNFSDIIVIQESDSEYGNVSGNGSGNGLGDGSGAETPKQESMLSSVISSDSGSGSGSEGSGFK